MCTGKAAEGSEREREWCEQTRVLKKTVLALGRMNWKGATREASYNKVVSSS